MCVDTIGQKVSNCRMPEASGNSESVKKWYRNKISEYQAILRALERDFPEASASVEHAEPTQNLQILDVSAVREYVETRGAARVLEIAKRFGVSKDDVAIMLNRNLATFEKMRKGWYRVKNTGVSNLVF